MTKFPEAMNRLFKNVFVCRKCKSRARTSPLTVLQGKALCKKCGGKALRPIKKGK